MDPTMTAAAADFSARLAELVARNTASTISDRIQRARAAKNDKETIHELEEIVASLISDKNEAVQLAQAYEQEFVAQKISKDELKYITDSLIPVAKTMLGRLPRNEDGTPAVDDEFVDILEPLLSIETLTILQLLGFNYKRAIGEPLTLLVQRLITSNTPVSSEFNLEVMRLRVEQNMALSKVAESEDASARFAKLTGNS